MLYFKVSQNKGVNIKHIIYKKIELVGASTDSCQFSRLKTTAIFFCACGNCGKSVAPTGATVSSLANGRQHVQG